MSYHVRIGLNGLTSFHSDDNQLEGILVNFTLLLGYEGYNDLETAALTFFET